jgi:indole-3-glycerol phosphate synthase
MDFLAKIVEMKKAESQRLREAGGLRKFQAALGRRAVGVSLQGALEDGPGPAIIAEVKRASPGKGEFAMHWDPQELALSYQENGAAAISVLTEASFFKGDPEFIRSMRPLIRLPILRKDFILEEIQVYQSAALGADALLLIVSLLSPEGLRTLLSLTHSLGMEALVEVHTSGQMVAALDAGARVIGVNSRDLRTLRMFPERPLELAPLAPPGVTLVAASGLKTRADIERYQAAGIRAFLIGEALVTQTDPGAKLREFLGIAG